MSIALIFEHLYIVLAAAVLSIAVGLPLGFAAYLYPKARGVILRIVDLFQTVPSLALLGIIMVFLGAGKVTVIVGITLYSLLPIVRNTYLGLQQVDGGVKEAARGMGMSRAHRLFLVEFPLAFPTVFTGIRIAVVNAIGTAVFAAFVGGGGLGSVITSGIRVQDMSAILMGTGALMVIAIVLDSLMGFVEGRIRKSRGAGVGRILAVIGGVMLIFIVTLPLGLSTTVADNEIVTYDGNYTTDQLGQRLFKYYVEGNTNLTVTIKDQMSQVNHFNQFMADEDSTDFFMSYDGSLLTTFLKLDPSDVPEGMTLYDFTNQQALDTLGVQMIGKLGFENTYAVAAPADVAEAYGLEKISDLISVADQLVFGAEHEFFTLEGTMKYGPFCAFYGLEFADAVSVDLSLKYTAVEQGSFEIIEVYTSDGLNRKANLVVLEDDWEFFPEYNAAYLVRDDFFEKFYDVAPELEAVLADFVGVVSDDDIVDMGYEVDVLGRDLDEVAIEFLQSKGFI